MDYFDPFAEAPTRPDTRFLALSFSSDWRFGTEHSLALTRELEAIGADVRHEEIASPWGHDSFLMDVPGYQEAVAEFLQSGVV
jgi:homoserine O-acetyltransferase/O-succinyltransferase